MPLIYSLGPHGLEDYVTEGDDSQIFLDSLLVC
jgi:hypothetical protein